jgi:hypothetical protein
MNAALDVDRKALARLAVWARLCCAPIRRPRLKWSGFNESEWVRLISLAAMVDRRTLLRLLGMEALTLLAISTICAALAAAAIFLARSPPTAPMSMAVATAAIIALLAAVLPFQYRIAFDFAANGGLRDALVPQAGDAELVAKVKRQNTWIFAAVFAGVTVFGFLFGLHSASIRPFLDQWSWLLYLLAVFGLLHSVVSIWRNPRSITKS